VTVSVGSTVDADDVMAMLTGALLPPQPANRLAIKRQGTVNAAALRRRTNP